MKIILLFSLFLLLFMDFIVFFCIFISLTVLFQLTFTFIYNTLALKIYAKFKKFKITFNPLSIIKFLKTKIY